MGVEAPGCSARVIAKHRRRPVGAIKGRQSTWSTALVNMAASAVEEGPAPVSAPKRTQTLPGGLLGSVRGEPDFHRGSAKLLVVGALHDLDGDQHLVPGFAEVNRSMDSRSSPRATRRPLK